MQAAPRPDQRPSTGALVWRALGFGIGFLIAVPTALVLIAVWGGP